MRKLQVQYRERNGKLVSYRKYCTKYDTAARFITDINRIIDEDQGNSWGRWVVVDGINTGEYTSLAALSIANWEILA